MSEYISREELIEALETDYNSDWDRLVDTEGYVEGVRDEYDDVLTIICRMKGTDVQPVKRGRWIDCTFYDPYEKSWEQNYEFKCSNCGHKIYNKPNNDNLFCGHCGARMEES